MTTTDPQDNPNSTWPSESHPKVIPGKYVYGNPDAPGLHRIATADKGPNTAAKDRACAGLPPHDPDEECDEYPFGTTAEGAASPDWDFSVKYIDGGQNGRGGLDLQDFYKSSRILYRDMDQFYVSVL